MTATNVLSESSLAFLQTESSTRRSRPEPEMIPAATAGLPASLASPLQRAPRLHWEHRLEKRIRLILACGAAATSSDRDTADLVVTDIKKGADILTSCVYFVIP